MTDNAQASPREATAEPSLAELFDPAALEARLAEARARRAAAIAKRAAANPDGDPDGDHVGAGGGRARIHTLDMAASGGAPAGPAPPSTAPRPRPVAAVRPAPAPPLPPTALPSLPPAEARPAWPFDSPERPAATPMAERLAAVVARASAPAPVAPEENAPWTRRPLAVLGLGLLVGGIAAGVAFVATRQSAPGTATVTTAAAPERPVVRAPAADPVVQAPVAGPAPPGDAALPLTDLAGVPASVGAPPAPVPAPPATAAIAEREPVPALPALELAPDVRPLPDEVTGTATLPEPGLAAIPPDEAGATALPSVPAEAGRTLSAIDAAPLPPTFETPPVPRVRFAAAQPEGTVRAALALPGAAEIAPAIDYALLAPAEAAVAAPASAPDTADSPTSRQPAAETAATRPARTTARPAPASPRPAEAEAPARAASGAGRARLERAVEDMLRDRLLGN